TMEVAASGGFRRPTGSSPLGANHDAARRGKTVPATVCRPSPLWGEPPLIEPVRVARRHGSGSAVPSTGHLGSESRGSGLADVASDAIASPRGVPRRDTQHTGRRPQFEAAALGARDATHR